MNLKASARLGREQIEGDRPRVRIMPASFQDDSTPRYPSLSGVGWVLLITGGLYLATSVLGRVTLANWSILLGELMLMLPACLYLRRHRYDFRLVFRLKPVSWRIAGLSLILGLAITLLAIELDRLINLIMPFPEHLELLLRDTLQAHNLQDWIMVLLAAVILAGAFEEMLFRGFVQNTFEQRHQPLFAIFVTAFLFGAVHLSPWWFVQLVFFAMFLGILAWKSGSIIPSAIIHAQNNFIAVLVINLGEERAGALLNWHGHVHPLLLVAAAITLFFGLRLFNRFCEEERPIPTLFNTPIL